MRESVVNQIKYSSKRKIVVNTVRNNGKSTFIEDEIIDRIDEYNLTNMLFVSNNFAMSKDNIYRKLMEKDEDDTFHSKRREGIKRFKVMCNTLESILVKNIRDDFEGKESYKKSEVIFKRNGFELDSIRGIEYEYAFFDECYPTTEVEEYLITIGVSKIYVIITDENTEYISDNIKLDTKDRFDNQINDLISEFECINKKENTVKTRNDILMQIKTIVDIKDRMGLK